MPEEITATKETIEHYKRQKVRETILRVSSDSGAFRWAVADSNTWYKFAGKKKVALPMDIINYKRLTSKKRTLYSTLSFFSPGIFDLDFKDATPETKDEAKILSRECVRDYTFGIDIDSQDAVNGHGANITEPIIKESVEAMARFFIAKLKPYAPKSIYAAFSGGGIYVFVHHGVFKAYIERFSTRKDYEIFVTTLTSALNNVVDAISEEFFAEYPQYRNYVKADAINNAKRTFKTIFSVHKRHPYAVIPLDTENIKIDFEKATLPLSDAILEMGENWYTAYDSDNRFWQVFLKPYLENTHEIELKKMQYATSASGGVAISACQHGESEYPPCIQHVLGLNSCGVGASRALAFLAAFLGQVGTPYEEAVFIWVGVAGKWGVSGTHIFESWYKKMNCPACRTLMKRGQGYPHVDIAEIKACVPNSQCMLVNYSSPVFYVDKQLYIQKLKQDLLAPLPEKPKTEKIKAPTKRLSKKGQALRSRLIAEAEQDGSRVIINPVKPKQVEQYDSIVTSVEGMAEFLNSEEEVTNKVEQNSKNDSEAVFKAQRLKANRDSFRATEHTELKGAVLDFKNALV